jgi:hypothetical protein
MNEVYVSAVEVLAPGMSHASANVAVANGTAPPEPDPVRLAALRSFNTRATYDPSDPHLPGPRESKFLRLDVAAALLCASRLLRARPLTESVALDTALFLATGLSQDPTLDEQIRRLCEAYVANGNARSAAQRNGDFFRMLPPLMPLANLSNSAACFIAQKLGIRGDNAVFGVTSHAGHAAFRAAFRHVASGRGDQAVVGGANAVGIASALAFAALGEGTLHEAAGAAMMLLESRRSLERDGCSPLCRVSEVVAQPVFAAPPPRPFSAFLRRPGLSRYRVLHGGSAFRSQHAEATEVLAQAGCNADSWFDSMGSLGAASVPCNVATGALIARDQLHPLLCLNRDEYGRESMIRLEPVMA